MLDHHVLCIQGYIQDFLPGEDITAGVWGVQPPDAEGCIRYCATFVAIF